MGKDGAFGIFTPDITSTIIGEGATVAEAKADFENSLGETIAVYAENGLKDPDDLQNVTFVYKYDLPSFLSYYNYFNISQLAKQAGINPSLMRQYKKGQYVSEKQVAKIQTVIHKIGAELAAVQLF